MKDTNKVFDHLLSSYNFEVPADRVAQTPADRREYSKVLSKQGQNYEECFFYDIQKFLPKGTLIVLNETKVFSCRLEAKTPTGARVEVFLLEHPGSKGSAVLEALAKPLKKVKENITLSFADGVEAKVLSKTDNQSLAKIILEFNLEALALQKWIDKEGRVPLPPYIKRQLGPSAERDQTRYQTVYAQNTGSVAAPTAGLHFTDEIISNLKESGYDFAKVTLHVGLGTFLPIKEEEILKHKMHEESYRVPSDVHLKIVKAKQEGRKVVLVGTTTLRSLESFYLKLKEEGKQAEELLDKWLRTDLFIYPRKDGALYKPQVGDALLTNFHQPCSSLFVLISALIGREEALKMYQRAVDQSFRFYSYGDASLLWF